MGVGGAVLVQRAGGPAATAHHPPSVTRFDFFAGQLPAVSPPPPADPSAGAAADEPAGAEEALAAYLTFLVDGALDDAYRLLDAPSRRRYPTPGSWAHAQADLAKPVSFTLGSSRRAFGGGGDVVEVDVEATHEPSLDATRGLVPARSRSLWQVRREGDRWRVAVAPEGTVPILPPDADAAAAVRAWLGPLQACDRAGSAQYEAGAYLYGPAVLVEGPCSRPGDWRVGAPVGLDRVADPRDFLAAFGPAVNTWARAVPVEGPGRPFLAVVAPGGDTWKVMGVAVRT